MGFMTDGSMNRNNFQAKKLQFIETSSSTDGLLGKTIISEKILHKARLSSVVISVVA